LLGIAAFVAVSVWRLDTLPPVYEDEPWQASTAYKLASQAVFGSDVFAGWNGMEQHYYGFMPVHPLLMALVFKLFGEGLLQARLEAILAGTLTLGLTLVLARQLFSGWVGALAVWILLLVRWTGTTTIQVTGIPFVDLARIARYDAVVPVFALAALVVHTGGAVRQVWYAAARRGGRGPNGVDQPWRFGLAGLFAGLAGLTHVYGLFWVFVLALLLVWQRAQPRAFVWLLGGVLLPWVPYVAYVLSDLPEWHAQVSGYADRFGLLDPRFYVSNLLEEPRRYGPGLGPPGLGWLARPGFWTLLVLVPASLIGLARRAIRHQDLPAQVILVPAVVLPLLYALLLRLKLVNYTLTFLPVLAIAAAWGSLQLAGWLRDRPRPLSLVAGLLALAVGGEGVARLSLLESLPATPYASYIAQVHRTIPTGARVVGSRRPTPGPRSESFSSGCRAARRPHAKLPNLRPQSSGGLRRLADRQRRPARRPGRRSDLWPDADLHPRHPVPAHGSVRCRRDTRHHPPVGVHWTRHPRTRREALTSVTAPLVRVEPGSRTAPSLERAIVEAVAYADVFDYPLTADEVHRYLAGVAASRSGVRAALANGRLVPRWLSHTGRYYCLPGREHVVETRRERTRLSETYWRRAIHYGRVIAGLPFVRLVAVTGALAMDNVADDDVDYMIVTEPGRLWLCRALIVGLVRVAALSGTELCPNYFLSERALILEERNLFTAHEVTQMVPLAGMPTYQHLRDLNRWTDTFLPNATGTPRRLASNEPDRKGTRLMLERTLRSRVCSPIERWEMNRKMRKLGTRGDGHAEAAFGPDWCKGHFGDHGQATLARYAERLEALGV
jgi:4-amino-4-deoxy-L-arabinose transferase-like glycosyltransferase